MKYIIETINGLIKTLNDVKGYALRHTFASRLYAAGVSDKAIQDILGHEKVDTTLNVYVHLLKKEDSELIQRVREFFVNNNIIHILEWHLFWHPFFNYK